MCQAISEGGRRCPAHRRDTIAVIHVTREAANLPQDVTEDLFTELRREARHLASNGGLEDSYDNVMTRVGERLGDTEEGQRYQEIFAQRHRDERPAPDTMFALTRLQRAATERSANLHQAISDIADERGITLGQARSQWEALRGQVKSGAITPTEDEWNADTQADAFDDDMPSDRASVVALSRLRHGGGEDSQGPRRISEHVDLTHRHRNLVSGGYDPDGGRLEIVLASNPDVTYAYRNVPETLWEEISETSDNPMGVFGSNFPRNDEYAYESREAAEADAYQTRCESCGQFRASSHSCPERVVNEVLETEGREISPTVVERAVEEVRDAEGAIADGEVSPTEIVNALANEPEEVIPEVSPEEMESNLAELREYLAGDTESDTEENRLELPYERNIPDNTPPVEEGHMRELDARIDQMMLTVQEISARDSNELPSIDGDVSQSGSFEYREVEPTVNLNFNELDENGNHRYPQEVRNRYQRRQGRLYHITDVPEGVNGSDYRETHIIFNEHEDISEASNYYSNPRAQRYVGTIPHEQFEVEGSHNYYGGAGNIVAYHAPVRDGVFQVSEHDRSSGYRRNYFHVTDEERQRVENEYRATADGQLTRENVERNATVSRAYAPRVMHNEQNLLEEHRVAWASVRDVRRVLAEDGATIAAPIEYRSQGLRRGMVVRDEHGNTLRHSDGEFTVTGTLAVTREGDNLRTTSGRHELQCDCAVYRRNYHCRHIDFVRDNGYRIAHNMSSTASTRRASGNSDSPFQVAIANRADFRHTTEEDGTLVATFASAGSTRRSRPGLNFSSLARRDDYSSVENPSVDDTIRTRQMDASYAYLPGSRPVRQALSRAGRVDVEAGHGVSVNMSESGDRYGRNSNVGSITGTSGLTMDDNGDVSVSTERLRCSCGRFQSARDAGGECPHIQRYAEILERHYGAGISEEDLLTREEAYAINSNESNQDELAIRARIANQRRIAENNGETVDDAVLRERAEAEVVAEREEAERRRQAEIERRRRAEEERAERERLANASFAERAAASEERVRAERQRFFDRDPEFARDLALYRAAQNERWETVEAGYGEDIDAIRADFESAKAKRESDTEKHLEPLTENVTDGVCDPNVPGHRKFGVELEFDFPRDVDKSTAIRNILADMREAGLTEQSRMGGYHSGAASGWAKWNLEADCTVDGELVSPLMDDTPENWEQMGKALEILKRHGARPSTRAGSHIHVSTGSYTQSLAKFSELAATMQDHQRVLYRAAGDPGRRQHRGMSWCSPNVDAPSVDIGKDQEGMPYNGDPSINRFAVHGHALNLESSTQMSKKEHAEFRLWDSSLDLATVQQQIATSVALVEHADRTVENSGQYSGAGRRRETLDHETNGSTDASDASLKNAAAMADRIFRRHSDRQRFMAMFAANKWV